MDGSEGPQPATRRSPAVARATLLLVCFVLATMVREGLAQTPAIEPLPTPTLRPIVANPFAPPGDQQGLSLTLSAAEEWERNNLATAFQASTATPSMPIYQRTGFYSSATAALDFGMSRQRRGAFFTATASAGVNAYSLSSHLIVTNGTSVSVSLPLGRRTRLGAHGNLTYAPYYNFGLFPGLDPSLGGGGGTGVFDPNINLAIQPARIFQYGAQVSVERTLSTRNAISGYVQGRYTDFRMAQPNLMERTIGARFTHRLSPSLSFHLGYGFGTGETAASGTRPQTHNIDVGFDYARALSFSLSPKTTFSFSTGSSLLSEGYSALQSPVNRFHFRITGSADLVHEMGRTWSARVAYRRGWEFVDLFVQPVFLDTVTLGVGGVLNPRTTFGTHVSYLHGSVGGSSSDQQNAWSASSVVRVALVRTLSFYTQYHYYRFAFTDINQLPASFPVALNRQGARAGVSLRMPLFQ